MLGARSLCQARTVTRERSVGGGSPSADARARAGGGSPASRAASEPLLADADFALQFGESVIVEFIRGHAAADVLRELVQNEYDAGGGNVAIHFGSEGLTVRGSGRPIDEQGWRRLSVMLGTGAVVGVPGKVEAKSNGIGSKNFGLRSLFLFGDRITIRSGGQLTALDRRRGALPRPRPDPESAGRPGVEIYVPYRTHSADKLLPFDADAESKALDEIARGLPYVLVKLAKCAGRPGIGHVAVLSDRHGTQISWRQSARVLDGATGVGRTVRIEGAEGLPIGVPTRLDEIEFQRGVLPPPNLRRITYPGYYKRGGGRLTLGVAFRLRRGRLEPEYFGRYFYPLAAAAAGTGYGFDINAPFEMNEDRSRLVPPENSEWNAWLIAEAASLAVALLPDLYRRFGVDAYRVLTAAPTAAASVDALPAALARLLATEAVWPAVTRRRRPVFALASSLAVPEPALMDLLEAVRGDGEVLHRSLTTDSALNSAAQASGARSFGVNALVRVRSAGQDATHLYTKVVEPEISLYWSDYPDALAALPLQLAFATAFDRVRAQLNAGHRADLAAATATLTAAGTLAAPSAPLYVVPDGAVTAVPSAQRLHPELARTRVLADLCRPFNMSAWAQELARRASSGDASDAELDDFAAVLRSGVRLSASAWAAVRRAPILPAAGGGRVAAADAARRTTPGLRLLGPAVPLLTQEDERNKLLEPLRVRNALRPSDLVSLAALVEAGEVPPERFTAAVSDLPALLTPKALSAVADIACLRTRSGELAPPSRTYTPTAAVLAVLDDRVIGEGPRSVLARLRCPTNPRVADIRARLAELSAQPTPPPNLAALHTALVDAAQRERFALRSWAEEKMLWAGERWAAPAECLIGSRWRAIFSITDAVPVLTGALTESYARFGAHTQPTAGHWRALLESIGRQFGSARAPSNVVSALVKTYAGLPGPPDGLDRRARCLLDTRGRLHSLTDVAAGVLLLNDDPGLAEAISNAGLQVAFADQTDSRAGVFWRHAEIQTLSSAARVVRTRAGAPVQARAQSEPTLARLHSPAFASAAAALASAVLPGFRLSGPTVARRLRRIRRIEFVSSLERHYRLRAGPVTVPIDLNVESDAIQLRPVTSQHELNQAVARAVAVLLDAGARAELLLADPMYFLLRCATVEELRRELARRKITWAYRSDMPSDDELEQESTLAERLAESLLNTGTKGRDDTPAPTPGSSAPPRSTDPPPRPPLPDLSDVRPRSGTVSPPRPLGTGQRGSSGGGASGGWSPRTERQRQEDEALGRQGEEIVLREERGRLAARGIAPELAVWVAEADPAADHDIRSVHEDGGPLFIEVKSTRGCDGRFAWPRAEFQLAVRQRRRYVLTRVYEADTTSPLVLDFVDPVGLLREGRLTLDVEELSADIGAAEH